jgi:hypothetical protein
VRVHEPTTDGSELLQGHSARLTTQQYTIPVVAVPQKAAVAGPSATPGPETTAATSPATSPPSRPIRQALDSQSGPSQSGSSLSPSGPSNMSPAPASGQAFTSKSNMESLLDLVGGFVERQRLEAVSSTFKGKGKGMENDTVRVCPPVVASLGTAFILFSSMKKVCPSVRSTRL